jgi:hypothetical protein
MRSESKNTFSADPQIFSTEGRVVGSCWEKLKPEGPKGVVGLCWAKLKPKGPQGPKDLKDEN